MIIALDKNFEDSLKKPLEKEGYTVYIHKQDNFELANVYVGYANQDIHKKTYPKLEAVQLMSASYTKLNIERLKKEGVLIANARGVYSDAIAEYVIAQILSSLKDLETLRENQMHHVWDKTNLDIQTLIDAKVYYLGTGSIASEIEARLRPFKTQSTGFNSNGRKVDGFDECFALDNLKEHISKADIIIASLPDNKHTRHIFDKALFALIKEGAILVNVGRGSLLNELSMQNHTKHLRKIILDVFEMEPLSEDSYLWDEPNVIVTPHMSFISKNNTKNLLKLV
ncbi:MAG TPA: NAD(P)-dependent oxidoreductase, partial [Erysipelothrix sp.]|nr:NAD(P)-dependent oxidoreductase [Erysipelothrix sp.]